ncbi:hypothetical protein MMC11_004284 [Xylographa trunciseda]|nr:hypothetical protein [Xylographa trunciseda]
MLDEGIANSIVPSAMSFSPNSQPASPVDVLVIGGGPAGLTAAITLARQRHTAVVFDSGTYRNAASSSLNLILTWDGESPAEFRAAARQNILARYSSILFRDVAVVRVAKTAEELFEAVDAQGRRWTGRKLIIATGMRDIFPAIDGYAACWGKGIFHCLMCSHSGDLGATSGILAEGKSADLAGTLLFARAALQLTPSGVTIYTHGSSELAAALAAASATAPLSVDSRVVSRVHMSPSGQVVLAFCDGSVAEESFLGHRPQMQPAAPGLIEQLGLQTTGTGEPVVGKTYETSVRGVFAAGDAGCWVKFAGGATFSGTMAAWGAGLQLQAERWGMDAPQF